MSGYEVRPGYTVRDEPLLAQLSSDAPFQPDVYRLARLVARAHEARTIVDVGAGDAVKTAELLDEFDVIALDRVARKDAAMSVDEYDIQGPEPLPVCDVVVRADVIEHLTHPEKLLQKIKLVGAGWVISTPERHVEYGYDHDGPPKNPRHVREWTVVEFDALLQRHGMDSIVMLTRSHERLEKWATIVAISP